MLPKACPSSYWSCDNHGVFTCCVSGQPGDTGLLNNLTPKGVIFSFLFLFLIFAYLLWQ